MEEEGEGVVTAAVDRQHLKAVVEEVCMLAAAIVCITLLLVLQLHDYSIICPLLVFYHSHIISNGNLILDIGIF